MIDRLDGQARRRAAELEEEARQRQLDIERRDRALWDEVSARGAEDGYRRYLRDYPDGLFAAEARRALERFERDRAEAAAAADRSAWQEARRDDSIGAYRQYLDAYPRGAFVNEARARISELDRPSAEEQAIARARAAENALGLNPVAKRLAEARLKQLGLKPGKVDGRFDDDTRGAIRRYQRARDLPVSGYLDQATVVRLLADAVRN